MSRSLFLVLLVCLAGGCDASPEVPALPSVPPPHEQVATGTRGVPPAPKKTPEEQFADSRRESDEIAVGLLNSFRSRVYDPRRDGLLDHAEGEIAVRMGGTDSKYRFVYDVANKAEDPVLLEPLTEASGADRERFRRVRQWAIVACCGPYGFVASYVPPIPLAVTPPTDRKSKNIVIWAKPFRGPLNASYSVDERQVVVARGEWTDDKNKVVTNFDWTFWRGRYLMSRSTIVQGATIDFDYDDRSGVNLLVKARARAGLDVGEAVFTYTDIRLRAR
jgi:hypothetical protein